MTARPELARLSLAEFTAKVAERSATPGGGSVAAHLVAMGAALTAMALRFTSGEKYKAVEAVMQPRIETLAALQADATALIDRDSSSYDSVTSAYKLPKATDAEKAQRSAAVQAALRGALEVPLATMQLAIAVLRVNAESAEAINPNLASDCATGALCAWSGLESAFLNVQINAKSITDPAYVERQLASARAMVEEARVRLDGARRAAEAKLA